MSDKKCCEKTGCDSAACNAGACSGDGKPKLFYFNGRGRAELIRLVCAAKGSLPGNEWEDHRLSFDEWPALKESAPFHQLPYMVTKCGKKVGESMVIARALAHKMGLAGNTDEEKIEADMIATACRGVLDLIFRMHFEEKEEERKEALRKKIQETVAPNIFGWLNQNYANRKFFMGDHITWADLAFYDVAYVIHRKHADEFNKYEHLANIYKNVEDHPNVKAWLEIRPQTEF